MQRLSAYSELIFGTRREKLKLSDILSTVTHNWKLSLVDSERLGNTNRERQENEMDRISYHLSGAPNENIVQNHLNIALLNVF